MPLLSQAPLHVVGGAAVGVPLLVGVAVVAAQGDLHLLEDHAQAGSEPHPHQGAGATGGHSGGHTGDVAKAHRAADGGADGLKGGDHTLVPVVSVPVLVEQLPAGALHNVTEVPELEEAGADGEVEPRHHHQHDEGGAPEEGVELVEEVYHDVFSPFCRHKRMLGCGNLVPRGKKEGAVVMEKPPSQNKAQGCPAGQ